MIIDDETIKMLLNPDKRIKHSKEDLDKAAKKVEKRAKATNARMSRYIAKHMCQIEHHTECIICGHIEISYHTATSNDKIDPAMVTKCQIALCPECLNWASRDLPAFFNKCKQKLVPNHETFKAYRNFTILHDNVENYDKY